ncbi:MAG: thioredoxin family protein [Marinilabiliaceae bacterium]|nr:thioredoxin family protein [Marinilabiliaceae bacterium]
MKRIISTLTFIFTLGILAISAQCCNNPQSDANNSKTASVKNTKTTAVQVYYFHATRRCATCQAVETVTTEALKEYYGNKIVFKSINRDEEKDNPMIAKYKVNGQTLLIVKGDKVVNLTNDAFMNARTNPNKLKAKIKATIDSLNN